MTPARVDVCVDCRHCRPTQYLGFLGTLPAVCLHSNGRDVVSGVPRACSDRRNSDETNPTCPDFEARHVTPAASALLARLERAGPRDGRDARG